MDNLRVSLTSRAAAAHASTVPERSCSNASTPHQEQKIDMCAPILALCMALALWFGCCNAKVPPADTHPFSAHALLRRIQARGATTVLEELTKDQRNFDYVCDSIATGNADWLQVAKALHPAFDAYPGEAITSSIQLALPNAPERVLGLLSYGFGIAELCGSPFIEPEPGVAEAYEARTLAALRRLLGTELAADSERCATLVKLPH